MPRIADNFRRILEQIHEFEQSYNRPRGSVKLLAVSKQQPVDKIMQAYEAGQLDFGENYLQEAESKIATLADCNINWHYIGPLQSNKTRKVAEYFHWVQSIDKYRIAKRLSEQRSEHLPPLNVCIQVNLSGEASKSGVPSLEVESLCESVSALERLQLRGLMAIPAPTSDFTQQRQQFKKLTALFHHLSKRFDHFDTLSMGMSNDFEAAIAEGSTMVRLGTALFGKRL